MPLLKLEVFVLKDQFLFSFIQWIIFNHNMLVYLVIYHWWSSCRTCQQNKYKVLQLIIDYLSTQIGLNYRILSEKQRITDFNVRQCFTILTRMYGLLLVMNARIAKKFIFQNSIWVIFDDKIVFLSPYRQQRLTNENLKTAH